MALAGPGLAAADREVREVARTRGARAVTGEEATAAAVLSAMATADTVHIAAHGRLRTDNPMLSALEMADGPLTIYDLEQLDATARLVLLPACRSGQPSVHAGDEVMGLAQVLLALGSQTVIATVVPVPDEATHPLMVDLHARLAAGRSSPPRRWPRHSWRSGRTTPQHVPRPPGSSASATAEAGPVSRSPPRLRRRSPHRQPPQNRSSSPSARPARSPRSPEARAASRSA